MSAEDLQNIPSTMLRTQLLGCYDIAAMSGTRNSANGGSQDSSFEAANPGPTSKPAACLMFALNAGV